VVVVVLLLLLLLAVLLLVMLLHLHLHLARNRVSRAATGGYNLWLSALSAASCSAFWVLSINQHNSLQLLRKARLHGHGMLRPVVRDAVAPQMNVQLYAYAPPPRRPTWAACMPSWCAWVGAGEVMI
jgi:hypothetical protein